VSARRRLVSATLVVALLGSAFAACADTSADGLPAGVDLGAPPIDRPAAQATPEDPVEPVQRMTGLDPRKIALGGRLFTDPILHEKGEIACSTCHLAAHGGADGRRMSDVEGQPAAVVNTPTIYNVGLNFRFNWNGRFMDLEQHLDGPMTSPRVMATTFEAVVRRLRGHREYPAEFRAIWPDGVTEANVREALVTFERSLVTLDAPFDRFLNGDTAALSEEEREGYKVFKTHGCISCHQGMGLGGNMFQRFGVFGDYFRARGGGITDADLGLYAVTKREEDRHVFRVASLRNVALTAPYFHDGSAETLEEAVQTMSEIQLGRPLNPEQTRAVVAFLKTLTGKAPKGLP
jgi:cytochrome c peroxidase